MKKGVFILTMLSALFFADGNMLAGQQVNVKVRADERWEPGKWSRVEIEISGAAGCGPSRLQQDYPVGFSFRKAEMAGGDMFRSGTSLIMVWPKIPPGKSITVSYDVMPEGSLSGAVSIAGWFWWINDLKGRSMLPLDIIKVSIGQGRKVPPEITGGESHMEDRIVFRIQLFTSSSGMKDQELKRRLGVSFTEKITVVHSPGIYKYQAGECPDYQCALALLKKFREAGIEEAFIVAYAGELQISIEQARLRTK